MSRRPLLAIFVLLSLMLSACVDEPTPIPTFTPMPSLTPVPPTPTAAITPTPPFPTGEPLALVTYRHRSGVFAIPRPIDWEVYDNSTDQRLLVQFIPPVGFGSRITVDVTSPGPLTPDEMHGEAESYITRTYGGIAAYHETSRADLPDGRFQVVFTYNDGRGATGGEMLLVQQAANFFVTVRVFIADTDRETLASLVDSIISGFTVDPRASWGTAVGAINPAELLIVNTLLWQVSSDRAYYYGEVYNASPSAITNIQVSISVCSQEGAILSAMTRPAALKQMDAGGRVPFVFTLEKPQRGNTVCAQSVTADPALPDPTYTTDLSVQVNNRPRGGFVLNVEGKIVNPGLLPVRNIHLVVVVYDEKGTIVGMTEVTSNPDTLYQPGESLPVKYTFETLGGSPNHVVTLVEAEVVPPTNPSLKP